MTKLDLDSSVFKEEQGWSGQGVCLTHKPEYHDSLGVYERFNIGEVVLHLLERIEELEQEVRLVKDE